MKKSFEERQRERKTKRKLHQKFLHKFIRSLGGYRSFKWWDWKHKKNQKEVKEKNVAAE